MEEGYTQSIRCLICAKPARRGATLCAQCKAAVRRARHTPNVKPEYLPHKAVVRTDVRRSVERSATAPYSRRRATRAAAPQALGGWGTYATIIAFGLAVCLTGYLAIGENDRAFHASRNAEIPVASTAAPRDAKARKPLPVAPTVVADSEPSDDGIADEHLAMFESLAYAQWETPMRSVARASRGARGAGSTGPAAFDAQETSGGPAPIAVTRMPITALAAATVAAPEPVVPDRWQEFASSLSRCERDGVIAGLVCKERARLQYCEGSWGAAPLCPLAVASLNTR